LTLLAVLDEDRPAPLARVEAAADVDSLALLDVLRLRGRDRHVGVLTRGGLGGYKSDCHQHGQRSAVQAHAMTAHVHVRDQGISFPGRRLRG
jgi:hypothetical protein